MLSYKLFIGSLDYECGFIQLGSPFIYFFPCVFKPLAVKTGSIRKLPALALASFALPNRSSGNSADYLTAARSHTATSENQCVDSPQ